jgi:hypothetical protein
MEAVAFLHPDVCMHVARHRPFWWPGGRQDGGYGCIFIDAAVSVKFSTQSNHCPVGWLVECACLR